MKKLMTAVITLTGTLGLLASAHSQAAMDSHIEKALQQVCYSSMSDSLMTLRQTVKEYRLDMKDVANKIVCNGDDIGTFAAEQGAAKTANYLRSFQDGHVSIRDLAYVTVNVAPKS